MNKYIVLLLICFPLITVAQQVIPFEDFNFYFKSFEDGAPQMVEFQRIQEYKAGDDPGELIWTIEEICVFTTEKQNAIWPIRTWNTKYRITC